MIPIDNLRAQRDKAVDFIEHLAEFRQLEYRAANIARVVSVVPLTAAIMTLIEYAAAPPMGFVYGVLFSLNLAVFAKTHVDIESRLKHFRDMAEFMKQQKIDLTKMIEEATNEIQQNRPN